MRKAIVVLSCLCLGILAVLSLKVPQRGEIQVLRIEAPKMDFRAARETFPFSVIPGGIMDARELSESMAKDEVVREHYVDLNPSGMYFTRLKQPLLAYVSFRNGSTIGWTAHPVTIAANELVLTDGKRMVRARCGNRIEVQRPEPLPATVESPAVPPPDVALDTGLPGVVPPTTETPVPPRTAISTFVDDGKTQEIATGPPPTTPPTTGTPPTTVVPPPVWCCGDIGTPPSKPHTPKPPTSVPEPSSLLLLGAGGLAVFSAARRLKLK